MNVVATIAGSAFFSHTTSLGEPDVGDRVTFDVPIRHRDPPGSSGETNDFPGQWSDGENFDETMAPDES